MTPSLTLALDCSTTYLAVAIVTADGRVLHSAADAVGREHAARLPAALETALATAGARRSQIGTVRVGIGPGSYTGTRVAVAAAKGLARALGASLAGVSTFVALAANAVPAGTSGVVTLDARRGNVYAQACRHQAGDDPQAAPLVATLSEARKLPLTALDDAFPALTVYPAAAPNAAALAVNGQAGTPDALYL